MTVISGSWRAMSTKTVCLKSKQIWLHTVNWCTAEAFRGSDLPNFLLETHFEGNVFKIGRMNQWWGWLCSYNSHMPVCTLKELLIALIVPPVHTSCEAKCDHIDGNKIHSAWSVQKCVLRFSWSRYWAQERLVRQIKCIFQSYDNLTNFCLFFCTKFPLRFHWVFPCWSAAEGYILVVACRFVAETKQQQFACTRQPGQRYPPDFWTYPMCINNCEKEFAINFYASHLHFPDPSDPISPKDNPTRVPYSPKHSEGKDTYNPNDVLEKPGENTYLQPKSWERG